MSAVTMGFMEMYDPQKCLFLFDAYAHPSNVVNQRAVVGIVMGCLMHDNRMRNCGEIRDCVQSFEENEEFKKELQCAQMQILRSRETEKISKFMNEEFIPEMLKNPILKKDKTGLDSLAVEDAMNPEWEKWMESKDVKSKMNIMNQLYTTGADIHMASFANMKNFPFFREMSNWFLPLDPKHPDIASAVMDEETSSLQIMQQMIEGSEFCDSDSYSLYLFLSNLPQGTRQMMGQHVPTLTDEMREQIERRLNIKAYDIYGLTEISGPGVATDCDFHRGLHIWEDHFLPEVINPETGEQLPEGSEGELVITCLTKEGQPLIRYRTRDITRLEYEKCECGRTMARIQRFKGRSDDMLIIKGVNVFPSQVEAALLNVDGVTPNYFMTVDRVDNSDTLEVAVEVEDRFFSDDMAELEKLSAKVKNQLKSAIGLNAKIRLVEPNGLEHSQGKTVHVLDKRKLYD